MHFCGRLLILVVPELVDQLNNFELLGNSHCYWKKYGGLIPSYFQRIVSCVPECILYIRRHNYVIHKILYSIVLRISVPRFVTGIT